MIPYTLHRNSLINFITKITNTNKIPFWYRHPTPYISDCTDINQYIVHINAGILNWNNYCNDNNIWMSRMYWMPAWMPVFADAPWFISIAIYAATILKILSIIYRLILHAISIIIKSNKLTAWQLRVTWWLKRYLARGSDYLADCLLASK